MNTIENRNAVKQRMFHSHETLIRQTAIKRRMGYEYRPSGSLPDFDEGALRQSLMRIRARIESTPSSRERIPGPITPIRPGIDTE